MIFETFWKSLTRLSRLLKVSSRPRLSRLVNTSSDFTCCERKCRFHEVLQLHFYKKIICTFCNCFMKAVRFNSSLYSCNWLIIFRCWYHHPLHRWKVRAHQCVSAIQSSSAAAESFQPWAGQSNFKAWHSRPSDFLGFSSAHRRLSQLRSAGSYAPQ